MEKLCPPAGILTELAFGTRLAITSDEIGLISLSSERKELILTIRKQGLSAKQLSDVVGRLRSWFTNGLDDRNSEQLPSQTGDIETVEVKGIRSALSLGKVHLYGHSWGGFLDVAYAIRYSSNLKSLYISSGSSSTPLCVEEMWRLRSELPKSLQDTLSKYRT